METINGDLKIEGSLELNKNLQLNGNAYMYGPLEINGTFSANSLKIPDVVNVIRSDDTSSDPNTLSISPNTVIQFENKTRQMLNLWGSTYGIGIQSYTQYFRTHKNFAWFSKGTHDDPSFSPGRGGRRLMGMNEAGDLILSARTNPSADKNKSKCRALVDYTNKLCINYGNDFTEGVFIDGNANILSLVGKDHAYIEFYPKGLNKNKSQSERRTKSRYGWMGYGSRGHTDFHIANKHGAVKLSQASDFLLKKEISVAEGQLDKLMEIQPVFYKYKNDAIEQPKRLGVIAQEVRKIFPELVSKSVEDDNQPLTVDYHGFTMITLQAVRELTKEVDKLKEKLKSFSNQDI